MLTLQLILHHHSQETDQTMESTACLHYIETANSVLHEVPWVVVKEYKVQSLLDDLVEHYHNNLVYKHYYNVGIILQVKGLNLSWDDAKSICEKHMNRENANFDLELVYGLAGKQRVCIDTVVPLWVAVQSLSTLFKSKPLLLLKTS